jgi:hypothetical protein
LTYHILVNIHQIGLILHRGSGLYSNPVVQRAGNHGDAALLHPLPPNTERLAKTAAHQTDAYWSSCILAGSAEYFAMTFDMVSDDSLHGVFLIETVELCDARHHSSSVFKQILAPRSRYVSTDGSNTASTIESDDIHQHRSSTRRSQSSSSASGGNVSSDSNDSADVLDGADDCYHQARVKSNIGGASEHNLENQLFFITYSKQPIGHTQLVVNIDHPYGVLVPDMWVKLYDFIMPLKDRLMATVGVWQQYLQFCRYREMCTKQTLSQVVRRGPIEPLEFIAAAVAEMAAHQPSLAPKDVLEILVNITNPDVFWIQDQTDQETWALVLHTTCNVRYCNDNRYGHASGSFILRAFYRRVSCASLTDSLTHSLTH